jgi:hypothetical protein
MKNTLLLPSLYFLSLFLSPHTKKKSTSGKVKMFMIAFSCQISNPFFNSGSATFASAFKDSFLLP